jgi:hypothetical protein
MFFAHMVLRQSVGPLIWLWEMVEHFDLEQAIGSMSGEALGVSLGFWLKSALSTRVEG